METIDWEAAHMWMIWLRCSELLSAGLWTSLSDLFSEPVLAECRLDAEGDGGNSAWQSRPQ